MQRPSSVKLAGVKYELYHPFLPTLRRMDMDDVTNRLPHEHSRTTTMCTREMFANAISTLNIPKERLHCKGVLSRQTDEVMKTYQPLNAPTYMESWNATLELLNNNSFSMSVAPVSKVTGLSLRSKKPSITSAWQHSMAYNTRPSTAKQIPTNMYSRHRAARRPPTAVPWK